MRDDLRHVDAGGVSVRLRDTGSGPAVICLHGTTANLGVWDPVVESLGDGVRAIALDQRGHGASDKPAVGYTAADYCHDVVGLVAELGCAPAVVAGHSLGARNAVVLGASRPDLVAGVIAVDYTPYVESQVLDDLEVRVRGGDRWYHSEDALEEYLRERYPQLPAEAIRRRISYGYARDEDGWRPLADPHAMTQTVDGLRCDFVTEMRQIAIPVTLVRGEHSSIVSPDAFTATRRLRPDVRVVELAGLDHYVPEESPNTIADEITRMLERVT